MGMGPKWYGLTGRTRTLFFPKRQVDPALWYIDLTWSHASSVPIWGWPSCCECPHNTITETFLHQSTVTYLLSSLGDRYGNNPRCGHEDISWWSQFRGKTVCSLGPIHPPPLQYGKSGRKLCGRLEIRLANCRNCILHILRQSWTEPHTQATVLPPTWHGYELGHREPNRRATCSCELTSDGACLLVMSSYYFSWWRIVG